MRSDAARDLATPARSLETIKFTNPNEISTPYTPPFTLPIFSRYEGRTCSPLWRWALENLYISLFRHTLQLLQKIVLGASSSEFRSQDMISISLCSVFLLFQYFCWHGCSASWPQPENCMLRFRLFIATGARAGVLALLQGYYWFRIPNSNFIFDRTLAGRVQNVPDLHQTTSIRGRSRVVAVEFPICIRRMEFWNFRASPMYSSSLPRSSLQ